MTWCRSWIIISLLFASSALGLPPDSKNFNVLTGLVDIPYGSYIEGSHQFGGMQPDYMISANDPDLRILINYSRKTRKMNLGYWEKVQRILNYVSNRALPETDYENEDYQGLSKNFKDKKNDIPIGKYISCGAGVCRENALLTHIALKEAGIENYHAYAQIRRSSNYFNYDLVEDHAFVVVEQDRTLWIVDSYYRGFNGFALEDVMSPNGVTENSRMAPIAKPQWGFRRIVKINEFPKVFAPRDLPSRVLNLSNFFKVPKAESCPYYFRKIQTPAQSFP